MNVLVSCCQCQQTLEDPRIWQGTIVLDQGEYDDLLPHTCTSELHAMGLQNHCSVNTMLFVRVLTSQNETP